MRHIRPIRRRNNIPQREISRAWRGYNAPNGLGLRLILAHLISQLDIGNFYPAIPDLGVDLMGVELTWTHQMPECAFENE